MPSFRCIAFLVPKIKVGEGGDFTPLPSVNRGTVRPSVDRVKTIIFVLNASSFFVVTTSKIGVLKEIVVGLQDPKSLTNKKQ